MKTSNRFRVNYYLNLLLLVLAFSIPLIRALVSVTAPLITILWLFEGRMREKIARLRTHPLTLAIITFILLNLVSLLWSSDPGAGYWYVDKYRYLLLIPVVTSSLRETFRHRVTTAYVAGSTIAVLLSLAAFVGLYRTARIYPGNPSPTMSHLDFSIVLAVAAMLILNRLAHDQMQWRSRIGWIALLVLHVTGLMVNIGRSGQLAFAGTLFVMVPLYLSRRSRRAAVAGLLAVASALCLSYLSVPRLHSRIDSAVRELEQSVTERRFQGNLGKRAAGAIVVGAMVAERPVLGAGAGDTMIEFRRLLDTRFQHLKPAIYWFPHLHNQYLQVAADLGLLGLAVLFGIFVVVAWGPYPQTRDRDLAIIVCCIYLLGCLGDPFLHKQLTMACFSLFAGIAAAPARSLFWNEAASPTNGGRSANV